MPKCILFYSYKIRNIGYDNLATCMNKLYYETTKQNDLLPIFLLPSAFPKSDLSSFSLTGGHFFPDKVAEYFMCSFKTDELMTEFSSYNYKSKTKDISYYLDSDCTTQPLTKVKY